MNEVFNLLKTYREVHDHTFGVMELATCFSQYIGFSEKDVASIRAGALLHDIGKLFIPKHVLFKTGKLTDSEFRLVKKHAKWGYDFLKTGCTRVIDPTLSDQEVMTMRLNLQNVYAFIKEKYPVMPDEVLSIVIQHHERLDGKGYPFGLKDKEIHLFSKVVALADVYDAITSERCYKAKAEPSYALRCIEAGLGTQFDERLGRQFIVYVEQEWLRKQNLITA